MRLFVTQVYSERPFVNIQTISEILLKEDSLELHMRIIRDIDSQKLSTEEIQVNIIHKAVGPIPKVMCY